MLCVTSVCGTHEAMRLTLSFFLLSDRMYYPLEVHMVHQNAEGDVLVIGVFLVRPSRIRTQAEIHVESSMTVNSGDDISVLP